MVDVKIRYFLVGEYGDKSGRPHMHAIIFGIGPGYKDIIKKAWTFKGTEIGHILVGDLNKNSARYVTGYCVKGLTNSNRKYVKEVLCGKQPEFSRSSTRNGGIGAAGIDIICGDLSANKHFDKNKIGILRTITIAGKRLPIGRYLTKRVVQRLRLNDQEARELKNFQTELINGYGEKGNHYYSQILKTEMPYIKQIEKRQKIYKQRKKI